LLVTHAGVLLEGMSKDPDVIVVGAGAAGLTASIELARAGLAVTILEARDRIGGRIFTLVDAETRTSVEQGAEFIHGRPPQIWNLLKRRKTRITEVDGDNWCVNDGQLDTCDFFSEVDQILKKMDDRKPDQSFLEFLEECCSKSNLGPRQEEAKKWALSYVSGFNAADPARVGVHWLVKSMRAEEKIEGDRAFRAQRGYTDLIDIFQQELNESSVAVQKSTVVESVQWKPGQVQILARGPGGAATFSAPRVLITVPLGVLQARVDENGAMRFTPDLPEEKRNAINNVMMGKVIRVTLRFRERFWKDLPRVRGKGGKTMDGMSFLLSHDDWFPTWWPHEKQPFLTGWAPFHCAERLSGQSKSFVVEKALQTLHRLLGVSVPELETLFEHAYCHDWQTDPFSRGAYSYGKVDQQEMVEALGRPIENTLFFAGEATDISGHNGTVHGAIASGERAAAEVLRVTGNNRKSTQVKIRSSA
jgi:monoamine oxidase